jgi:DNA repair protein RadC
VAVIDGAHGLVLVQNRPCGDPSPCPADRVITRSFTAGCMSLGLVAHDHIIIGDGRYFSASEAGIAQGWQRAAPAGAAGEPASECPCAVR